jgi:hypothetical protein
MFGLPLFRAGSVPKGRTESAGRKFHPRRTAAHPGRTADHSEAEDLIEKARELTGLRTKKAVVEAGLRALIKLHEQSDVRKLWGRLHWQEPEAPAAPETPEPEKKGKSRGGRR